ncbi:MAG: efflux RND transporter permease subunit, partial [Bacteroidales bacterium]|nr:efflux RND transporter permease subunit [Bacteroidales bacterium]
MRLFSESLSSDTFRNSEEREIRLIIRAQMPLGGTAAQLNEKVILVDQFLSTFKEIEGFETRVEGWGATIEVKFKEEYRDTSFPYILENKVIGKVITIGGADWSTYGVSERGFSNSLNLQYRSNSIEIAGYNYDRLYRIAEDMCAEMKKNNRVVDLIIETPGHERQEDEFHMVYDKERMALYDYELFASHRALKEILSGYDIDRYEDENINAPIHLKSNAQESFDLWHVQNAALRVGERDLRITDFMAIEKREAKNCIPKENQEYVLRVAFNILGSYTYTDNYIKQITEIFNAKMPVGYRCKNRSYGYYEDDGTQYWLIGLIAIIIFF